jgi:hypothetical protein
MNKEMKKRRILIKDVEIKMLVKNELVNSWYVRKVDKETFNLVADLIELSFGADSTAELRRKLKKISESFYGD